MSFRGGEFSTGTTGNFQPELTLTMLLSRLHSPTNFIPPSIPQIRMGRCLTNRCLWEGCWGLFWSSVQYPS